MNIYFHICCVIILHVVLNKSLNELPSFRNVLHPKQHKHSSTYVVVCEKITI